ncbi:MAG: hypothetical protein IJC02_02615 [Lachnospiraceae bacterium]|nr:hypothetical protein [Lachnospiraceae bacterium]
MSRCRCSDISNTENKIRKLESACGIMSGYSGVKGRLDAGISQWSGRAEQATVSNKVTSAKGTMTTLGDRMDNASSGITRKINAKLGELRSSLSSMRSEDHNYHEEERRRREAEEAAARAAAAAALAAKNTIK